MYLKQVFFFYLMYNAIQFDILSEFFKNNNNNNKYKLLIKQISQQNFLYKNL